MNFEMLIIIENCEKPEELWSKINRYCQNMLAEVEDKTYIRFSGQYEDAISVFEQCIFHGKCEISISQRK